MATGHLAQHAADMVQSVTDMFHTYACCVKSGYEMIVSNTLENMSGHQAPPLAKLDGKVCIVTGASAGIGFVTSQKLAHMGAHVILACRSRQRGEEAVQVISRSLKSSHPLDAGSSPSSPTHKDPLSPPGKLECMELDLASLDSVRSFIRTFNDRKLPLHLLICNAGIMSPPERQTSKDGLEVQFQVNFLSHWLLIHGLLSEQRRRRRQLRNGCSPSGLQSEQQAAETGSCCTSRFGLRDDGTRVVSLSSCTHTVGKVQWKDMQSVQSYSPFRSYAFSKLGNNLTATELHRRLKRNTGYGADSSVAVHPGIVDTFLALNFFETQGSSWTKTGPLAVLQGALPLYWSLLKKTRSVFFRTTSNAADTVLYAALAPAEDVAGRYIVPQAHIASQDKVADDESCGLQVWDLAARLTQTQIDFSLL